MSSQEVAPRQTGEPVPISPELEARIKEAVASVPGDDGTGYQRIVEQLLNAATIDELNEPWNSTSGRELAGKVLRISGLTQRPSAFTEGPQIFLVADATDTKTGEKVTLTTSAVAVIIQLAVGWKLGMFPIIAEVVVAERPTERGFYPYHLRIIGTERSQNTKVTAGEAPF